MDLPTFNSEALASLSSRIADGLKKPASKSSAQKKAKKSDATTPSDTQTKQLQIVQANGVDGKIKKRTRDGKVKTPISKTHERVHQRENGAGRPVDGRKSVSAKQTGNGLPKPNGKSSQEKNVTLKKPGKAEVKDPQHTATGVKVDDELLEEVTALGGNKDDLDLIKDVDSASELEGEESKQKTSKSLKNELQAMIKDLGITKLSAQDIASGNEDDTESTEDESIIAVEQNPNDIVLKPRKVPVESAEKKFIFTPQAEWHTVPLPPIQVDEKEQAEHIPRATVENVSEYSKELLETENKKYAARNLSSSSAHQFYSTIMTSGTLSDKISALTLSVQESPLHNMRAMESLLGLAKKRSRGQAVEVLGALKDLLGPGSLLPSDRRLRFFNAQPGMSRFASIKKSPWQKGDPLPKPLGPVHLVAWAFEDWLKTTYFEVLKILETWCNDEVVFARSKAVDYVFELLRDKPEQEANLLRLLVNKLGDADKKIASRTSYNILQLQTTHPLMKDTIITSIESDLLFRPGQTAHARYYAIITLNQTILSGKEEKVARRVLDIYFSLFLTLLAKKPEKHEPAAVATVQTTSFNRKGEKQGGGGAPGKKALQKLKDQEKGTSAEEELREKMLSAVLTGVNRALPYVQTNDEYFDKHMDTLFRVTHSANFNTSIQALMLIQQLCGSHQAASDRFYRTMYESLLDPRILTSSKQALYLNLLYRALRADLNVNRVKAFAKRLLQVVAMHQPPFVCGVLYLLRELESVFPTLAMFIDQPEEDEDDEEENFQDVQEVEEDLPARAIAIKAAGPTKALGYNGKKRDPEYSHAEKSCLWDLEPFLAHFHPSVAMFAERLLTHNAMPEKPDLATHTLIHFLDRFVYRNPKKTAAMPKGSSIMQPMAGGDASGVLVAAKSRLAEMPVNSEAFWKRQGEKISADEVFFHKYFNTLGKNKQTSKKQAKKAARRSDEDESDASGGDEEEEEIWKALVDSRPEVEGVGGSDEDDLDLDDLESAMDDASSAESDAGVEIVGSDGEAQAQEEDDDGASDVMDFDDDDALLDSDEEVPGNLDELFAAESKGTGKKISGQDEGEGRKNKRRRLKNLPTFASADDYAAMLDEEEDGR